MWPCGCSDEKGIEEKDTEHSKGFHFLDASSHFYMRLCLSVRSSGCWMVRPSVDNPFFDAKNHWGSPTLALLNVLDVLNVLNALNVLNVLNMPKDISLVCWGLYYPVFRPRILRISIYFVILSRSFHLS